jgi:F-type H+-transporting ATPase subunit a
MPRHRALTTVTCVLACWPGVARASAAEEGAGHEGTWLNWLYSVEVAGRPLIVSDAALAFAWSVVAILLLGSLVALATRRVGVKPKGAQILLEMLVGALRNMVIGVMGPRGVEFLPFIGTIFIYIAFMNLLGLVPGFMAPTSNLSITAGLAVMVFFVVHYYGVRESGVAYLKHFIEGVPLQFPYVLLAPLVCAVHLVGEMVRPVTLALRLFGNMMAGHIVLTVLIGLVVGLVAKYWIPLPIQLPNMALEILVAIVQAMIFALLTTVYLSGVLHKERAEEH